MLSADINYLAVIVAAIVHMIVGALWFSPALFGKKWMAQTGMTAEKMKAAKANMPKKYVVALISALVMAFITAHFINFVGATTLADGIQTAFWIWLGFIATVTLGKVLWDGKPIQLYILENGYNLVSLAIMGAILALWV